MHHHAASRFRRFQATTSSFTEAQAFFDRFYRKFGQIGDCDYLCSETATEGPATGPITARIGFVPWPYPINQQDRVDFDKLLSESRAREVAN